MSMALSHDVTAFVLWLTTVFNFCQASEKFANVIAQVHGLMSPM